MPGPFEELDRGEDCVHDVVAAVFGLFEVTCDANEMTVWQVLGPSWCIMRRLVAKSSKSLSSQGLLLFSNSVYLRVTLRTVFRCWRKVPRRVTRVILDKSTW